MDIDYKVISSVLMILSLSMILISFSTYYFYNYKSNIRNNKYIFYIAISIVSALLNIILIASIDSASIVTSREEEVQFKKFNNASFMNSENKIESFSYIYLKTNDEDFLISTRTFEELPKDIKIDKNRLSFNKNSSRFVEEYKTSNLDKIYIKEEVNHPLKFLGLNIRYPNDQKVTVLDVSDKAFR